VPLGVLQAIENQMPYPGLPDWLRPLVMLVIGVGLLWLFRGLYSGRPKAEVIWLGAALGALAALSYTLAGALGTPGEAGLALLDALSLALSGVILASLPFYYQPDYPDRQAVRSALLAFVTLWAFSPTLMALRGYWIQGQNLAPVLGACGLLVGSLLVLDQRPQIRFTWPGGLACLFVAMAIPLMLTDGLEGDWMIEDMSMAWSAAGYQAMLVALVLGGLLLWTHRWLVQQQAMRWMAPALAVVALVALPATYLASGGPGFQPEMYLVVLNEQADTESVREIEDWQARRLAAYAALTGQAAQSQAGLRSWLDERGASYTPFYLVNALEVQGGGLRRQLAGRPEVATILNSPQVRPLRHEILATPGNTPAYQPGEPTWNIKKVAAEQAWDDLGITGDGMVIGIADSGVDETHPVLKDSYLGADGVNTRRWYDPWEGTLDPTDDDGHGTGTAGVALGSQGIGVAPGARWIACRNLARNLGNPADYLRCMQFLFAPFPPEGDPFTGGDPRQGAHLTSNSWGCPPQEGCDLETLGIAVGHLTNAGQPVVVSAGNDGPACGTIGTPANAPDAISVGATDELNLLALFSSRGPADDGQGTAIFKPDFVAPGAEILTSWVAGSYSTVNGTSFAGPHVAGTIALMWQANPALIGDIPATRQILADTAAGIQAQAGCGGEANGQNNAYGFGVINAYQAVQRALASTSSPAK
jgi:hypothetical protein